MKSQGFERSVVSSSGNGIKSGFNWCSERGQGWQERIVVILESVRPVTARCLVTDRRCPPATPSAPTASKPIPTGGTRPRGKLTPQRHRTLPREPLQAGPGLPSARNSRGVVPGWEHCMPWRHHRLVFYLCWFLMYAPPKSISASDRASAASHSRHTTCGSHAESFPRTVADDQSSRSRQGSPGRRGSTAGGALRPYISDAHTRHTLVVIQRCIQHRSGR